jgi:hypothetical protein
MGAPEQLIHDRSDDRQVGSSATRAGSRPHRGAARVAASAWEVAATRASCRAAGWPLERVLFALAGSVTLISALLAAFVSPWFLLLTAFVGVNQWLYVLLGACPASIVLRRFFSLRSAVYPRQATR